jgi:hypothetical protein
VNCACHDEPAYWNKDKRYKAGGFWYCAVKQREKVLCRYENLTGLEYAHHRLRNRRVLALRRMKARHERS